jgi:uncharacterized protein YndB with AHSA1/START domain
VADTPGATRTYEHEIAIDAPPEAVFAYFTDPVKMVRWMGSDATLDPRPGGICRVSWTREIGESAVVGKFVEVVPYTRVVFTWGWENDAFGVPPASTRVEVVLRPQDGGTVVRLTHSELPETAVPDHEAGWSHYLERLSVAAAGRDPGIDDFVPPGILRLAEGGLLRAGHRTAAAQRDRQPPP